VVRSSSIPLITSVRSVNEPAWSAVLNAVPVNLIDLPNRSPVLTVLLPRSSSSSLTVTSNLSSHLLHGPAVQFVGSSEGVAVDSITKESIDVMCLEISVVKSVLALIK